jgi:surface protein
MKVKITTDQITYALECESWDECKENIPDIESIKTVDFIDGYAPKNLYRAFDGFSSLTHIDGLDTSQCEDMFGMFWGAEAFNQDISGWDTSNVENMDCMFDGATSFNQDLSGWDVSNVEKTVWMFEDAISMQEHHKPKFKNGVTR